MTIKTRPGGARRWHYLLPCACLAGRATLAQNDESSATALEEVVVTGTKRDISQQDLPVAVSTITADSSETFQNDVTELAQLSPNVTLTPQNGFNALRRYAGTGFISILVTRIPRLV